MAEPFFPEIEQVSLIDYKVRIVDGHAATAATLPPSMSPAAVSKVRLVLQSVSIGHFPGSLSPP